MLKKLQSICLLIAMLAAMTVPAVGICADMPDYTLAEFNSVEAIESYMKAKTTLAPSTENVGMYEVTGKATINPDDLKDLFNLSLSGLDASGYGYLNMWVYSPTETASYVRISLYDTNGKFQAYSFEVNWNGWKVVSIPFDKPITVKPEFQLSTLGTMYVGTTGWEGTFGTWTSEHYLNFDKVWLSVEMPEEAKEEDKSVDQYGNKTLAEFSSQTQIDKLKAIKPKMAIEATTENTRLYEMSAKATISLENPESLLNITNLDLDFSLYSHLNFWVYSPKKTAYGIAVPIYDDKGEYCLYSIPVDFEGWKMICINLQEPLYQKDNFDITKVTSVNVDFNQWVGRINPWEEDGYINIDRVWLSPEPISSFKLTGSSYPQNCTSVPSEDLEMVMEFSNPIASAVSADEITLYKNSEVISSSLISVKNEENKLYLSFEQDLEKNTDYELKFSFFDIHGNDLASEAYCFRTQNNPGKIYKPVFLNESFSVAEHSFDGVLNVSARVEDAASGAYLTVAVYDSQNRNTFVYTASFDEQTADEIKVNDISIKSDDTVIAFVCKNFDDMTFLRNDYAILLPADTQREEILFEEPSAGILSAQLSKAEIEGNLLTLEGSVASDVRSVVFSVADESEKIKQVFVLDTAGKTEFTEIYDLTGITLENGNYSIYVSGYGFSKSDGIGFYYISPETQEKICKNVNSALSGDDVESAFEGNETSLQLDKDVLQNAYLTIYEQKPYDSFQNIIETAKKSEEILSGLNECNWTTLAAFLDENEAYVLHGVQEADYYFSLKERDRNKINDEIYKLETSFDDFADFRKVFIKVVNKFEDGDYDTESKPSNSSGGGGGGGGRVSITPAIQPVTEQTPQTPPIVQTNTMPFNDMDTAEWAKPYVESLYAKGIISHADKFRPDDKITREEFLKLILESFEIQTGNTDVKFKDVEADAWYARYVAAAYDLGIVNGESETHFGVGKPISRQDAAVMLYRTATMYNMEFAKSQTVPFADEALIASYAIEAVKAMQSEQIINGAENGCFLPHDDMTRAEAAKIVSGVLNKRSGEDV